MSLFSRWLSRSKQKDKASKSSYFMRKRISLNSILPSLPTRCHAFKETQTSFMSMVRVKKQWLYWAVPVIVVLYSPVCLSGECNDITVPNAGAATLYVYATAILGPFPSCLALLMGPSRRLVP